MSLTVDLGVNLLPDDHRIWKLFPGEGYKFLTSMLEQKSVFIDIRDLNDVGDNPLQWDKPALVEHVSEDRWLRQQSENLIKSERRTTPNDRAMATMVEGFYKTAKKGDFIAIPHPGQDGNVTIARLKSTSKKLDVIQLRDGRKEFTYLCRPISILGTVNKRDLPFPFFELLHTPMAFFDTGDSAREKIYKTIIGSHVYDGVNFAKFTTSKEVFTSRDNRIISTWMEFIDVACNSNKLTLAKLKAKSEALIDLIDAANLDESERSDLAININSPGDIIMKAIAKSPLVALALWPMAIANIPYQQALAAEYRMASAAGLDTSECEADIQGEVKDVLIGLGAQRWKRACEAAVAAANVASLKSEAKII